MESTMGSFAASPDIDTLFLLIPAPPGAPQWYYTSLKRGKQAFSYDRTSPTFEGQIQAFIDAVQAQAIRD